MQWIIDNIFSNFTSEDDKLRINSATSCNDRLNKIESMTDSFAYSTLYNAISNAIPSFSKDVINLIVLYLCYGKFYFGIDCSLNINVAIISFNLFDINGRLCYIMKSHISNYSFIAKYFQTFATKKIVINLRFIGDNNSYKMQHESQFIIQHNTSCFLMSWIYDNTDKLPSIYFIKCFDINSKTLKCENLITMKNSTFVQLRRNLESHSPKFYEIRCIEKITKPIIIPYLYERLYLNAKKHTNCTFKAIFEAKDNVFRLFGNNQLFQPSLNGMRDYYDYFMFDLCIYDEHPGLDYIGKFRGLYINMVGMNKIHNTMDNIAKIWFQTKYDWDRMYTVLGIKIINNKLFMIFRDIRIHKTFVGYIGISDHNVHPQNRGNILYVMHCWKKVEISCGWTTKCLMGNIQVFNDKEYNRKMIKFRMRSRNVITQHLIDDGLRIIDEWSVDNTGIEYSNFWFGRFFCDFPVEIQRDYIVVKENDIELKQNMNKNHKKQQVTDGVLLTTSLIVLGGLCWFITK